MEGFILNSQPFSSGLWLSRAGSPVTASSPDSALYLANNQLYNLQLQNGVYGVAVVYTRD